jgi:hypothetical protein
MASRYAALYGKELSKCWRIKMGAKKADTQQVQ